MSTELVMVKLRKTPVDDLRVRVAAVLVVAAIVGWQFLPVWLRFAVVMYAGWPVVAAVVLAGAVGWLTLNWTYCLKTGGVALAGLLLVSVIAIDVSYRHRRLAVMQRKRRSFTQNATRATPTPSTNTTYASP